MPLDQIDIDDEKNLPEEYRGNLPSPEAKDTGEMSFLEHLETLRKHLFWSGVVVVGCAIFVAIYITYFVDNLIMAPTQQDFITYTLLCELSEYLGNEMLCFEVYKEPFINRQLSGLFTTHIKISLTLGVIISFPFILLQIWNFIKPALHANEKKTATGIVMFCSFLFFSGVAFSYYLIMPLVYNFFSHYSISSSTMIENKFDLSSYITQLVDLSLACGIMFQLPMFVYILSKLGLITPQLMTNYRKHSVVVIFFVSAILTPSDVYSMILVALPLLLLYEISIVVSKVVERNRLKESES